MESNNFRQLQDTIWVLWEVHVGGTAFIFLITYHRLCLDSYWPLAANGW